MTAIHPSIVQRDRILEFLEKYHGRWVAQWETNFIEDLKGKSTFTHGEMDTIDKIYSHIMRVTKTYQLR